MVDILSDQILGVDRHVAAPCERQESLAPIELAVLLARLSPHDDRLHCLACASQRVLRRVARPADKWLRSYTNVRILCAHFGCSLCAEVWSVHHTNSDSTVHHLLGFTRAGNSRDHYGQPYVWVGNSESIVLGM
eukprot:SAG31_NODE_23589_length_501_cov_0.721393_1_plen_133_part_10